MRSVLMWTPQFPHDLASGAARSTRTIGELLAESGWTVRGAGTTASEMASSTGGYQTVLREAGISYSTKKRASGASVVSYSHRNVEYELLDTGSTAVAAVNRGCGDEMDQLFESVRSSPQPDILVTYGGSLRDRTRRYQAREGGAKVVFTLHNFGYLSPQSFSDVDIILSPSRYLAERYRSVGVDTTPMPIPLHPSDTAIERHEPDFFTFVNPSVEKGVFVIARILESVCSIRPDIPFLVVEARGTANTLLRAAQAGGFDLSKYANIAITSPTFDPRRFLAVTRAIVMPSVWEEPAGRVAAEALVNGIPALVSDRGGLPEIVGSGGIVLPLDSGITIQDRKPPPEELVAPWVKTILHLADDSEFAANCATRARIAGEIYEWDSIVPQYVRFFESILE